MDSETSSLQPFEYQVGGHPGVLTTENGSILIKPALPKELAFYQRLQEDSDLEDLRVFTPTFLGTLKLQGRLDEMGSSLSESMILEPIESEERESIVLENLSFTFLKPNILDIKLGTVLYEETAPAEKVARMQKVAQETTSFETGVRLTGFQVYDNITSQPVNTPKSYGKSIKAAQLGEGIAKFFPVGSLASSETSSSGLPKETLVPILRAICEEIAEIRQVCDNLELRMVGCSLLIVYEADWTRAEQSLIRFSEEDEEEDEDEDGEGDMDMDDDEDESNLKRLGPPFVVKLIDFGHTRMAPGEGPDKGVLVGMDTVLNLLDARLAELST